MTRIEEPTFTEELDGDRIHSQCKRIIAKADGQWRTLREWAFIGQGSEAGTSARLRELNTKFGYLKEKKRISGWLWVYRLTPPNRYDHLGQGMFF